MSQLRVLCCVLAICVLAGLPVVSVTADHGPDESEPRAEAGLDQTVQQNVTVYLDAGGSHAPDGEVVAYEWEIEQPDGTTTTPVCGSCERTSFRALTSGEYQVTLTVSDDDGRSATDTMYVTVTETDTPDVSLSGPEQVAVGDEIPVEMNASAGETELQSVTWLINGEQRAGEFLDGRQATETLNVSTEAAGTLTVDVLVTDAAGTSAGARHQLTVLDGSEFAVELTDVADAYESDETVTPTVTVTNTGAIEDTQKITLEDFDGNVVDVEWLSLEPGESTAISSSFATPTFSWTPGIDFEGERGSLTVASETDADATRTEILEAPDPPFFEVSIVETELSRMGHLFHDIEVTNTGGQSDTQTIWSCESGGCSYFVDDDITDVSLDPGESETVTGVIVDFHEEDHPFELYARSDDDSDTMMVDSDGNLAGSGDDGDTDGGGDDPYPYFDVDFSLPNQIEIDSSASFSTGDITVWPEGTYHDTVIYSESNYVEMPIGGKDDERDIGQTPDAMSVQEYDEGGWANANLNSDGTLDRVYGQDTGDVRICVGDSIAGAPVDSESNWGSCTTVEVVDDDSGGNEPI